MKKKVCSAIFLFYLGVLSGCAVNPITGEEELMFFPQEQDIAIGQQYAPEVEKQMGGKIDNQGLQDYINSVGYRVGRVSHRPDLEYHFTALNDKTVNAFALPGGYLFITRGMLEKLTTEAQLAGILGHEITHVVARDTSAAMSREIGMSLLLAAVARGETPEGVLRVAALTRQILGLRYSRADERDADLAGLDYMVRAGYNPYGIVETMQILDDLQKFEQVEFFSTHPSHANRIEYLNEMIQSEYRRVENLKVGKEEYQQNVLQQLPENVD